MKKSKSLNARPKDTAVADGEPDPPAASHAGKLTSAHGLAAFVAVFIAAVRQPKIQDREDLLKPPP